MKVKQQRHVSREAAEALLPALKYSNMSIAEVEQVLDGYGWMIWNVGNLCWVLTMVNSDNEIEVLLAGGRKARECVAPWLQAMLQEPAHRAMTIRVDGRKGWSRYLKDFERRDGVLYMKVPDGQETHKNYSD
jgi:hypothetical protein